VVVCWRDGAISSGMVAISCWVVPHQVTIVGDVANDMLSGFA
jgi:hypothetical protein